MWWARVLLPLAMLMLAGCASADPCVRGGDCRWVVDTPHLGVWLGADPYPALVMRADLGGGHGVQVRLVWDRCTSVGCSWAPRVGPRPELVPGGLNGVLTLTRAPSAPDDGVEAVRPLPDGSRLRLGIERLLPPPPTPTARDLERCTADLTGRLAGATPLGAIAATSVEIELACRIWLHPAQGRTAMLWHPVLHEVARAHACDMAHRDYFGHVSPEGVGPNVRAASAGYRLPDWYDADEQGNNIESLALRAPTSSPVVTLEQWIASPDHRRHVLAESEFRSEQFDTAIGYCAVERDGMTRHYWAFLSARPGEEPSAPTAGRGP